MNVQKLNVSDYRNFETASFSFDPDTIHILMGRNAQGKTNLIEAIYFLSHLRSWRTSKTPSLIRHGQELFRLEATIENKGRVESLKMIFSQGKKYLFRNDKPVQTFSNFVGILNAVLFSPDDLQIFSEPPKERRKFVDMELVKLSRSYTTRLGRFNKLLKERSAILKSFRVDDVLLSTITDQMIEEQAVLIAQRYAFIQLLEEKARAVFPYFGEGREKLSIRYKTCVDPSLGMDEIKKQLTEAYQKTRLKDKQMKTTAVGIHKDDLEFYLNDKLVTQTASQGQKRSIVLALKIGLCQVIQAKTGQNPVLLLDDVFSELDETRRAGLIASLPEEIQIFITTAEPVSPSWFKRPVRFYTVDHGVMKEGIYDV
ncbi:DNA replication/repair protein RecF [Erysipelotrichaceae bacterium 51-3]